MAAVLQAASGGCQVEVFPGNVLFGDISFAHPVIEPIVDNCCQPRPCFGETTRGVGLRGFESHRPHHDPLTNSKQVVPLCFARVAVGRWLRRLLSVQIVVHQLKGWPCRVLLHPTPHNMSAEPGTLCPSSSES